MAETVLGEELLWGIAPGNPALLNLWQRVHADLGAPLGRIIQETPAFFTNRPLPSIFPRGRENSVDHAFPVVAGGTGLVVPLVVKGAGEWHVSDAFGTFGRRGSSPASAFGDLLRHVESAWQSDPSRPVLPLRWRAPLHLALGCPLHMDRIGGKSLQVPLVIAVLRAVCAGDRRDELPFGPGPVFATGVVCPDGEFAPAGSLVEKIEAFIREYGAERPFILSTPQLALLKARAPALLAGLPVTRASRLEDLFSLEAFAPALSRFCEPPALSELDALIPRIRQAYALIGFSDAQALSRWALRPELPVPYRETLLAIMALGYAHHAEAFEAQSHFTALAELLTDHHDKLGADDWLKSFATLAVFAFDACAPEILMPLSKLAVARLPWASLAARGAYWGSQCQVLRLTGDFDAAINAGERAVACAEEGEISAAGRNMNYLVHALLHRARKGGPDAEADRALARKLLHISRTQWRPSVGGRSHDGFCSLYEAELARQEGQLPPSTWDDYRGEWSHGLDFCLLVRARNQNIAEPKRVEYLDFALSRLAGWEKTELGRLILGWYKLYRAHLAGEEIDPISTLLQRSMDAFEAAGLPGWKRRLGPPLSSVARCCGPDRDEAMEHFLDAIPYW